MRSPTDLFRALVADVVGRRPRTFVVALAVSLTACGAEGIGLVVLVGLIRLLGLGGDSTSAAPGIQYLGSGLAALGLSPTLPTLLILYVSVMTFQAWLWRRQTTETLRLEQELAGSYRRDLYRSISRTRWDVFARGRSSDFTHVLTFEADRAGTAGSYIVTLLATAVSTAAYFAMALLVSPRMTAFVTACAGVLLLSLHSSTGSARAAGEALSQATARLYNGISEHLAGLKTARSYGAEARHARRFEEWSQEVERTSVQVAHSQSEVKYRFDVSSAMMLAGVVYVGLMRLSMPAANILLLLFLFARLMPRVSTLRNGYQLLVSLLPSVESVMAMQARCREAEIGTAATGEAIALRKEIRFERVTFNYSGQPAIRDLDLSIPAGQTTAIVGPSGAGKSTAADLMMGLLVADRGRLLVDDVPLGPERLESWRSQIGYVAQDTFLFHETVRANLLWARPTASEQDLDEALRMSAADEFVSGLPDGLDTTIGDRGVLLSGGERQRLALARALLRRPSVLILDEATSALDAESERHIRQAIAKLSGRMTVVIITHRLSAIGDADLIHVLEDGRVIESGTWDSLATARGGRFPAMCRASGLDVSTGSGRLSCA